MPGFYVGCGVGGVCGRGDNRGNGRGKQCKDALNVCAQSFAGRETIQAHTAPHPTENWVVYGSLAVMVGMVVLAAAIHQ